MQDQFLINTRSLPEQASDKVEHYIISQKLNEGDKIPSESELSSLLGVGRSTVREAIKILVARNILEIRRGAGTYVKENIGVLDDPLGLRFEKKQDQLALDLCEVRMMIEPNLAYMAALRASTSDIRELQKLCDEVADLIEQKVDYGQKDIEFHTKLATCTGNLVVPKLIPIINTAIDTYIGITNFSLAGQASTEHQCIVNAIRNKNPEIAAQAMKEHLISNRNNLMKVVN